MRNGAWDVTQTGKTVILLSGLLAALSTGACQRSAQTYLKSGDAHFKAQKYSDASLDYQNAIRIDAKLGEAVRRCARRNRARSLLASPSCDA